MASTDLPGPGREPLLPGGADSRAANADSATPVPPPRSAIPSTRNMLEAGLITGITAALAALMIRLVAAIFRAEFLVVPPWGESNQLLNVPWISVILLPLLAGVLGGLGAAVFLGVRHAQGYVMAIGTVFAVASVAVTLAQPDSVTWPTKTWLLIMIIATWLIVVPQVARIVGDSDPKIVASFRDEIA